ncbi:glycine zipper family protein [Motilimonas eburnea]|uniref:glycine zipper family protein n=1 Tax=Motilimonas eburnea TaxID=1737488 RepID=UPI001E443B3C|nr:glycine zipper family protein [Motilimonas eburnea]MCE2570382.1 glycine zipper family protein [Motilimonas eburnea]
MKSTIAIATLLLCTSPLALANLIIDTEGVDQNKYNQDRFHCEQLAAQVKTEQHSPSVVGTTAKGALAGAAIGAISGNSGSQGAKTGAGVGLAAGIIGKGASKHSERQANSNEKQMVMRNCMTNRGYTVLN